jgi:predicted O-methyltransferase YrrM
VEKLPDLLLEVLRTKRVFDLVGNPQPLESNVSLSEASSLHAAVRMIRPKRSLEIGLAHGISALSILGAIAANGSGHHYAIDPLQRNYGYCGEAMIARAGFSALHTFVERYPEEVIPNLPELQFAFIDSSHLFDFTILEFVLIDKKLDVGGIVALHDLWMPSIQAAVRFILANRAYQIFRDVSPDVMKLSLQQRFKEAFGQWLGKIRVADRIFRANVLRPWSTFRTQNLVFLRKVSEDQRDWRFHQRF